MNAEVDNFLCLKSGAAGINTLCHALFGRSPATGQKRTFCDFMDDVSYRTISLALDDLTVDLHSRNRAAGWWTDLHTGKPLERNFGELICLCHSEVSEAMEGHRKNLQDDKLPHRKMIEVELADVLIRLFDIAGGYKINLAREFRRFAAGEHDDRYFACHLPGMAHLWNVPEALGIVHQFLASAAKRGPRDNGTPTVLFCALLACCYIAGGLGYDLGGALEEKVRFNASRADHKRENRLAAGGKAY